MKIKIYKNNIYDKKFIIKGIKDYSNICKIIYIPFVTSNICIFTKDILENKDIAKEFSNYILELQETTNVI